MSTIPQQHDIVRFHENATTVSTGHVTRVWDKPEGNPYVTVVSEGRTFVRPSSEVGVVRSAAEAVPA